MEKGCKPKRKYTLKFRICGFSLRLRVVGPWRFKCSVLLMFGRDGLGIYSSVSLLSGVSVRGFHTSCVWGSGSGIRM